MSSRRKKPPRNPSSDPPTEGELRKLANLNKGLGAFQYRDDKGVIRTHEDTPPPPAPEPPPPEPVLSNERHPLSDVIDWVITHDAKDDVTYEQRFYRGIKDRNPAEFHKMRETLKRSAESEAAAKAAPVVESGPPPEAPFPELEEAWALFQEWTNARRD